MDRGLIAVTGAGGYVGGRLTLHLASRGARVRALVRQPCPWLEREGVEQVTGHLGALDGADAVVHLAAPNEVLAASDPGGTTADAILAAQQIAEAAVAHRVPRVVVASTVHVYGARIVDGARLSEDLRCEPRHPYAVARLACEHLLATSLSGTDTDLVVLRITNGVGAPASSSVDRWTLLVNDLARAAATTGELTLRTPGLQWRDFIALTDVCAVADAACAPSVVPSGTYNVGSGSPRTVRDVAELVAQSVARRTGRRPALRAPAASGPPPEPYRVDVSRLRACGLLGQPTPLETAVDETVAACLAATRGP